MSNTVPLSKYLITPTVNGWPLLTLLACPDPVVVWREYVVIIQVFLDIVANHVCKQENYNKGKLTQLAYKFSTLQSPTPHSLGALLEAKIKSYERTCKWKTIHWSCQKNLKYKHDKL